jgi:hypothetical protein
MEATTSRVVVHYFDPDLHRTLCGAGFEDRSTKHARGVTCQACMGLLDDRRAAAGDHAASNASA